MYINVNWNRKGCSLNKFTKHIHRVSRSKWICVYEKNSNNGYRNTDKRKKRTLESNSQTKKQTFWKTNSHWKNKLLCENEIFSGANCCCGCYCKHSAENNVFDRIRFCIYLRSIVNVWVGHVTVWVGHVTVWSVSAIIWVWYVDVTSQISHIINMQVSAIIHRYIFS